MRDQPFSVATKDQELLLTFTDLYLSGNLQAEVPRVGQVVVRHVATRRVLILTPVQWGVLKQFEGGCTTAAVLKKLILGRSCIPLKQFYELVVKAYGAGMLLEKEEAPAFAPSTLPWPTSLTRTAARRMAFGSMLFAMIGILANALGAPEYWWWWLPGWVLSCAAVSGGFLMSASVMQGAGRDIHEAGWVWRTAFPRFQVSMDDDFADPDLASHAELARLTPPFLLVGIAAWGIPNLALPLVFGLLWELAPRKRGAFSRLLRAVHYRPRPSVAYGFEFDANRRPLERLWNWFDVGELRYALLQVGYAIVWGLLAVLAVLVAARVDAREVIKDLWEAGLPARSIGWLITIGALVIGGAAGFAVFLWGRKHLRRFQAWRDERRVERSAPPPQAPTAEEIYDFLGRTYPLQLISDTERMLTAASFEIRSYPSNALVVAAGDREPQLRILYAGSLVVDSSLIRMSRPRLLPGTIFGERALLHDEPEKNTVRSAGPCIVLALGKAVFEHRVQRFIAPHVIEDAAQKIAFLREIPITRDWPQPIIASFARRAVIQTFTRNTLVLEQGRENTLFFLVLDGELRIERDKKVVARLSRGAIFGEISLLQSSLTQASVYGHRQGSYLCISKPDFVTFMSQNTALALQIEDIASRRLGSPVFAPPKSPLRRGR